MSRPGATAVPSSGDVAGETPGAGRRFGDYELRGEIARGGQGVVYRARDLKLNRDVALKMLPFSAWASEENLRRFRSEAQLAADLDHPAIVPIYEIGECDGQHYFTMKLIDGQGLNRVPPRALPPRRAAEIIVETARALAHAHARGVLHRDIKPGNIILDTTGHAHITDFGLAKLIEGDGTLVQTVELLGTPSYISPEMAQGGGRRLGPATDVYGLGAVLYQLLTGNAPFAGGTTLETIRQVVENEPRPPRQWDARIDRDLEVICLKCLEKDPALRYASARELADDLERWLRHLPIVARRGSVAYRAGKWLRRHRPAAALAIVALVAGGGVYALARRAAAPPLAPAMAVLFRPGNPESKYLTTEFARNIIHALGTLPGVTVAPRGDVLKWETVSAPPEAAGKALGVPIVLAGTFEQRGDGFEFHGELIDIRSGARLWSRTFQDKLAEASGLQAQLVRVVASKLGIALTGKNRAELQPPLTKNPEAWLHYLRARQNLDVLSEQKLLAAIGEFEQCLAHDPDFAQAYAGLANAHLDLGYTFRDPAVHLTKARDYVREALKRDETLVEAMIADGVVKYFLEWDWQAAEKAVHQAVLLDPSALENHACYLHSLESLGRTDEALKTVQHAFARHPSSIALQSELGCAAYYATHFDEAVTYWREALKNAPENPYLYWGLGRTLAQQEKFTEAATVLEAGQRKPDGDWAVILTELAYIRGRENRRAEALALIEQLRGRAGNEFVDPYLFAMAYSGIGDTAEVFRHLEAAVQGRSTWIPSLPVDPKFAALRSEPQYHQLLATLRLPTQR